MTEPNFINKIKSFFNDPKNYELIESTKEAQKQKTVCVMLGIILGVIGTIFIEALLGVLH